MAELLYNYLETSEGMIVSGISPSCSQAEKIFEIFKVDAVIVLTSNQDFAASCLQKINCRKVLMIIPDEIRLLPDWPRPGVRIRTIQFTQNYLSLTENLNLLFNEGTETASLNAPNYSALITCQEKEILTLIIKGLKTREIANELFLSEKAIENHRKNILKKTECKSMLSLVNKLLSIGFFQQ